MLLSVKEVAKLLSVSSGCVYTLVNSGRLKCYRVGVGRGVIRIEENEVAEILESQKQEEVHTGKHNTSFFELQTSRR